MVIFVGAGPGAEDLITVRGQKYLQQADQIIYAGSLVNPALLDMKKETAIVKNSAYMTLEEVIQAICEEEEKGGLTVRLHTGDPCLYGAIREQMDELDARGISYEVCPGVSSFSGAAAALQSGKVSVHLQHMVRRWLFSSVRGCCRNCRKNFCLVVIRKIHRRRLSIRQPGRKKRSATAPSELWQRQVRIIRFPRQR